jgi:hypothetical protein
VTEDPPPTNNGTQEQTPARQDVDVLLDVSELEVDKIKRANFLKCRTYERRRTRLPSTPVMTVKDLRAHVSVVAELASLVSLQVGVDARLDEVELEIEGVRAKVLLKVRLDDVRAILQHALDTVAEHPQILRILTRTLDEVLTRKLRDALGTLENVLGSLEDNDTVDELLKGGLEDVRDTLQEILSQVGERAQEEGATRQAVPEGPSSSAGEPPGGALPKEE